MQPKRKGSEILESMKAGRGRGFGLRPPKPEGANASGATDYIPSGRRGVRAGTSATLQGNVPANMNAALRSQHQKLAHEVASGLRRFTFAQVAKQQPKQG